jgi:hypothetical protein
VKKTATVLKLRQDTRYFGQSLVEVLVTSQLTIDSVARLALTLAANGVSLKSAKLVTQPADLTSDQPIDCDAIERYRTNGYPSATQHFANESGLTAPGLETLCQMLADNNGCGQSGRGGYLKTPKWSFAKFLRQVDEIESAGATSEERVNAFLPHAMRVIATYLAYAEHCSGTLADHLPAFVADVPELASFATSSVRLERPEAFLTLPGYLVARHAIGVSADGIRALHALWQSAFVAAQEVDDRLDAQAQEVVAILCRTPDAFQRQPYGTSVVIEGTSKRLASRLWDRLPPHVMILILRDSDGHMAIMSRFGANIDLGPVYGALKVIEPDCWYLEGRFNKGRSTIVLNGGGKVSQSVAPTSIPSVEFPALVSRCAIFPKGRH